MPNQLAVRLRINHNSLNLMVQGIFCPPIQSMSPQFDNEDAMEDSVKSLA